MQDGLCSLSWHAVDSLRDNPETRELSVLIVTDRRMLHILHHFIMTHELQCATPLLSILWTKRWQWTAMAGSEEQWRGSLDDENPPAETQ